MPLYGPTGDAESVVETCQMADDKEQIPNRWQGAEAAQLDKTSGKLMQGH